MSQEKPNNERASSRTQCIEDLFLAATQRPQDDRTAFVRDTAGEDQDLAEEVLHLLAHQDDTRDEDAGVTYVARVDETHVPLEKHCTDHWIGRTIGSDGDITIEEIIGSGGMGAVYKCQQHSPLRTVAVKILREAIPSERALRRFEFEAQTLARMDHPGIARIHAADLIDENGIKIPYFVMAYIDGASTLIEYADKNELDLRERLTLFQQVCEAIGHAHQKGVLHRDLKPANILVDRKGRVQVIDFGVARAIGRNEDADTVLHTQAGHIIGTPRYMAPEQLEGMQDLDARVDVYTLGVLLYELICGKGPYANTQTHSDICRAVLKDDPTRPSSLDRSLRGDIEAILLKALDKERDARYRDAVALGEEIGRFLRDEPVLAQPPTLLYTLRKVARRNRPIVGASAVAVLVILLAAVISTSFFFRERTARADATAQAERAEAKTAELQQVVDFHAQQLRRIEPERMAISLRQNLLDEARSTLVRRDLSEEEVNAQVAIFERALEAPNLTNVALKSLEENIFKPSLEAIETQFADQPLVRTQLLGVLSGTTQTLGLLDFAMKPAKDALAIRRELFGDAHRHTLSSVYILGLLLKAQGKLEDAEVYLREASEGRQRALGPEHPQTLDASNALGLLLKDQGNFDEAEHYLQDALDGQRRIFGVDHPITLNTLNSLGVLLQAQGRFPEAEAYCLEALEGRRRVLGPDHPQTFSSLCIVGFMLHQRGELEQAEHYLRESLAGTRRVLGDDHPQTLTTLHNTSLFLNEIGKHAEAEFYCRKALDGRRRILGSNHQHTLTSMSTMGSWLLFQGRYTEAEPFFREVLRKRKQVLGNDHPSSLDALSNLGMLLKDQGKLEEAETYLFEVLEARRHTLGVDHPSTLKALNNMGLVLKLQGKLDEATPFYHEALEGRQRVLGNDHPSTLLTISNLAKLLRDQGKLDEAERYCRDELERRQRVLGADHPDTLVSQVNMGLLLQRQDRLDEAETFCQEARDALERILGADHLYTLFSLHALARLRDRQNSFEEAESLYNQLLERRRRVIGEQHPTTIKTLFELASVLKKQNRYDEALTLATECEASSREVNGVEHEQTLQAVALLNDLHAATAPTKSAEDQTTRSPEIESPTHIGLHSDSS